MEDQEKIENEEKSEKNNSQEINLTVKEKKGFGLFKLLILIALFVIIGYVAYSCLANKKTPVTIVRSILTDQKVISQLSTLIVPYGGIYKEYDEKDQEKVKLAIAYSGTVTYGIDFSKIDIEEAEDKKIIIKIPEIVLVDVYVEPKTTVAMPEDSPNELANRLSKCKEDLRSKFEDGNDEMRKLAYDSTRETLQNFIKPIADELKEEYDIIVE